MSDPTIAATPWRYAATYPKAFWLLDARLAWPVLLWLAHLVLAWTFALALAACALNALLAVSRAARADGVAPDESRLAGLAAPAAPAPAAVYPVEVGSS